MNVPDKPKFAEIFADTLRISAGAKGWRAFIPARFLLCSAIGAVVAVTIPSGFWVKSPTSEATAVYGAILAFNGLLLALGWGTMSRIYDVLARGRVSNILVKEGLLAHHLNAIDMGHFVLIASATISAGGLLLTAFHTAFWIDKLILGLIVGLSLYSLLMVWSILSMMTSLIWEDAHLSSEDVQNVVSLKKNGQ